MSQLGQPEKSLANASEAMRLDPKDSFAYPNLADAYADLGRYDEARASSTKPLPKDWDLRPTPFRSTAMAFIRGDEAGMQRAVELGKGPSVEPIMLLIVGQGAMRFGQDTECQAKLSPKGSAFWRKNPALKELAAAIRLLERVLPGRDWQSSSRAAGGIAGARLSDDRDTRTIAADTFARAGDASRSQKLIDELAKEFPTDTLLNSVWLPVARATNQIKADQAGAGG